MQFGLGHDSLQPSSSRSPNNPGDRRRRCRRPGCRVPARSSSRCQSALLRASRDTSSARMIPTSPSATCSVSCPNPSPAVRWPRCADPPSRGPRRAASPARRAGNQVKLTGPGFLVALDLGQGRLADIYHGRSRAVRVGHLEPHSSPAPPLRRRGGDQAGQDRDGRAGLLAGWGSGYGRGGAGTWSGSRLSCTGCMAVLLAR